MKAILSAVKSRLRSEISYARNDDVYITEDERMVRTQGDYPAIGIKDSTITYLTEDKIFTSTFLVSITGYIRLYKPESGIMGDDSTGNKGILDLLSDIKTALHDYLLEYDVHLAIPLSQSPSTLLGNENIALIHKTLTMKYKRFF